MERWISRRERRVGVGMMLAYHRVPSTILFLSQSAYTRTATMTKQAVYVTRGRKTGSRYILRQAAASPLGWDRQIYKSVRRRLRTGDRVFTHPLSNEQNRNNQLLPRARMR